MGLETTTYIDGLVITNPTGSDAKNTADDHLRLIKSAIKATFPNLTGAVTPTHTELNYVDGVTSAIQTQIDTKGAHAGQVWTGTHNYTGATLTMTTQSAGDNSTKGATTSYVDTGLALKGNINAQTWTGTHTFSNAIVVPTMTAGDNSTNAASTAFTSAAIAAAAFSTVLPSQAGNAGKFVTTNGTTASWASVTQPALILLATATASAVATVDFTSLINSTYAEYLIIGTNVIPSTNDSFLWMRTSTNAGSSFDSGASDYRHATSGVDDGSTNISVVSAADTKIVLSGAHPVSNSLTPGFHFTLRLHNPSVNRVMFDWTASGHRSSGVIATINGAGIRATNADVDAIRFLFSTGNIASGEFRLYGVQKS